MISASRTVQCTGGWYHAARDNPTQSQDPAQGPRVHLDQVPHGLALLLRPYSFFAIRSFIAALSSASSAYIRLSLAFSASRSLTRRSSEASRPPYFDFHL